MSRTKKSKPGGKKRVADDDFIEDDIPVKKPKKSNPKAKKTAETTPKKKKAGTDKLTADDFEPSDINLNERLTEPLLALAKEEMDLGNKFKGISLKNAALMLKKYPHAIESGAEALKLKGIGKSIAKKIDDILANGAISKSDENDENQEKLANIEALSKVYGINHTLAASLVRDHSVNDVVDLVGKQELLEQPARIGLKYFKDFQEPIPREEVESILDSIRSQTEQIGDIEIREHGPYTRQESSIDEIHVLVAADKTQFTALLDALHQIGLITDTISSSETVVKTVCVLPSVSGTAPDAVATVPAVPKKIFSIPKFSQIQPVASSAPNLFAERSHSDEKPHVSGTVPSSAIPSGQESPKPHLHLHRRLEFRHCSKQALPIVFTNLLGPPSFFCQLQATAQSKGYVLAAKTLREQTDGANAGKHISVATEQELFEKLGLEFIKYEDRADVVITDNA